MDNCLFCKIIRGDIPSAKVYEDDKTYAFRDIAPMAPTHVLVVPKTHVSGMSAIDELDDTTLAACRKGVESVRKNAPAAGVENQTEENFVPQSHPKFEMYEDKSGQFRFRLKARNGQIIATSEGYTTKNACENGVESVRKNAPEAAVEEA